MNLFFPPTLPPYLYPHLRGRSGFTLIETLIVISILGVLAVVIVTVLNPLEQISRARDTTNRSDASRLAASVERFYALNGYYPWQSDENDAENQTLSWGVITPDLSDEDGCPFIEKLGVATSENCTVPGLSDLRQDFLVRIATEEPESPYETQSDSRQFYMFYNGLGGPFVCFAPTSKAFREEAIARAMGQLSAGYPDDEGQAVGNQEDCGDGGYCVCVP